MEISLILGKILASLKSVKGIDAIALGGSRAKGNDSLESDFDIGIYYSDRHRLDLKGLNRIATELDDQHRSDLVTNIGEWGPWINCGGWLCIDGVATDFLLRDLNKVLAVIDDCLSGKITIDYQPGHPHGFVNTIYVAETHYCKILWCANNILSDLKWKITPYPLSIKRGIVNKFLWEAKFSVMIARKGLLKGDIVYTTGCVYRAISCLVQTIYALNETYIMNEKGALANLGTFKIMPKEFKKRSEKIFYSLTADVRHGEMLIDELADIVKEVEDLCVKIMTVGL